MIPDVLIPVSILAAIVAAFGTWCKLTDRGDDGPTK